MRSSAWATLRKRFKAGPRGASDRLGYLDTLHDKSVPLPEGAAEYLREDNPKLVELRRRYASLDLPMRVSARWNDHAIGSFLDLKYFRGETLFYWHYREDLEATRLKYRLYLQDVMRRDRSGLMSRTTEDGAFGCWTFEFPAVGLVSRDRLESVNELAFLERHLQISAIENLRILDIGAGYGRLGHRAPSALKNVFEYCCVDAIPESTFLCDYYLRHRQVSPPAHAAPLYEVAEWEERQFDLALNVHSFSECSYESIRWWLELISRLGITYFFLVPNEPRSLLSLEDDGSRRDFAPLIEKLGYALIAVEPVIEDLAVRETVGLDDHFHLYELRV